MLNLGLTLSRINGISSSNGVISFFILSAGKQGHSLAISNDGTAYTWGTNTDGRLGNGSTSGEESIPFKVYDFTPIAAISAGGNHSLAMTSEGEAYAWGGSLYGQLGNGSTAQIQCRPVPVCGGLRFTSISAGSDHSLAIANNGVTYAWGRNLSGVYGSGAIGNGTTLDVCVPVPVCGGLNFTSISAGNAFSLGITNAGVAYAWGANANGQLGDNSTTSKLTPVQVCGGLTFTAISAGCSLAGNGHHSLGITTSGTTYAWGSNSDGRLGNGTFTSSLTPVQVCGGLTFTSISAGGNHSLGIANNGVTYAWGTGSYGVLGNDSLIDVSIPVPICGGLTFTSISAGSNFSLGITDTGESYGWGYNYNLALGLGTLPYDIKTTPTQICSNLTFTKVSSNRHVLAISSNGTLYAWGNNSEGQLGNSLSGIGKLSDVPVPVCGNLTFTSISAGNSHSLGITITGAAYAWGNGANGRIGDNAAVTRSVPVPVCGGLTFTSISAGDTHSLGITNTGVAYAWGNGTSGQLGNNALLSRTTPVQICGGLTFTSISAGNAFSLGITNTGAAYAWGVGSGGRLGNNAALTRSMPVPVCGGLTFTSISAGGNHSLGIANNGVTYAWGNNSSGQLGINTTTSRLVPTAICGGLTFTAISAGNSYSLGITNTGEAYAWGTAVDGVLGDETFSSSSLTPVRVCGGLTFTSISASSGVSIGLAQSGAVYSWGSNERATLGLGITNIKTPTKIINPSY